MKILPRFTSRSWFLLAALAAGVVLPAGAQQLVSGLPGQQALGQRYVGADAGVADVEFFNETGYTIGAALNVPVLPNLDLGLHTGHGWIDQTGVGMKDTTVSATAVVHRAAEGPKPFVGVLLGHQKLQMDFGRFGFTENSTLWGAATGIEVPLGSGSLTPSVGYTDSFDGNTDRTVHCTLHGNYWFTARLGGYVSVTYADLAGDGGHAWVCRAGLRVRF